MAKRAFTALGDAPDADSPVSSSAVIYASHHGPLMRGCPDPAAWMMLVEACMDGGNWGRGNTRQRAIDVVCTSLAADPDRRAALWSMWLMLRSAVRPSPTRALYAVLRAWYPHAWRTR